MVTSLVKPSKSKETNERRKLVLRREPTHVSDGKVTLAATLESDRGGSRRIWFEIPEEMVSITTGSMDPFVIASVFFAMEQASDLHIYGQVSPSLLANLTEFQAAWHKWFPQKYIPANITAEFEREQPAHKDEDCAIAAFSGGVDSTYTILRHRVKDMGRMQRNVEAALMVHGFDIPLEQDAQFERAAETARQTLATVGVKLLTIKTNLYNADWEMTHGAAIAACLTLVQERYNQGLIASTYDYTQLGNLPWGSNTITDRLLSSDSFTIVHDGSDTSRYQKHAAVAQWDEGHNNLHVCYSAEDRDTNCCACGKCIMTIISLRYLNLPRPRSFPRNVTNADLLKLNVDKGYAELFTLMAKKYRTEGMGGAPWFLAFELTARKNLVRTRVERFLPPAVKEEIFKYWRPYWAKR